MMYLIFAEGALIGSTSDSEKLLAIADKASKDNGVTNLRILRTEGRWCTFDGKGNMSEHQDGDKPYRPAPETK